MAGIYSIGAAAVGAGGTILGSLVGNNLARQREAEARRENYKYNEMSADNADRRTRALYNDFYSPQALMRQYQEAGLSPSLMYGGTPGQGGMSGAQAASSAVQPTTFGVDITKGLELGLMAAEARKLNAEAKKTEAETPYVEETQKANIASILATTDATKATKTAIEWQAKINEFDAYIKDKSKEHSIYYIAEQANYMADLAEKTYNEARSAKVLANVDEATFKEQVQLRIKTVEKVLTDINLEQQQIKDLKDQIIARIEKTRQDWEQIDINKGQQQTYTEYMNAVIPTIEKQIEIKLKELGIEKWKVATGAVTDLIKSAAIGAMAYSQMTSSKGITGEMTNPKEVLVPSQPYN